ncbi:MAG: SCO family protein [Rhodomicrobium sp.]|nr:SCO family protein [Rhodomicrobium sp.]
MRHINRVLFVIALFVAGFAVAYTIVLKPQGARIEGKALVGGPFSLVDTEGKRMTDRDFRGKLMLVFFGYTHCPDVCPTELQNMTDVIQKLGPEALSAYAKNFSPRITGLTGSRDEVASAAKAYRVYFKKAGSGSDDYSVDHSSFVYLMDREGNYLTHFTFNTPPDTVVSVIKKHILG